MYAIRNRNVLTMHTLNIDIETYSPVDLKKCGMYKYAESPEFEILLIAYSVDDGEEILLDLAQEDPFDYLFTHKVEALKKMLLSKDYLKKAYNAQFERVCLEKFFGEEMPPDQWECTMIKGAMLGLPMGLASIASVLKLEQQKDFAGANLIRYFCLPCKPTATNGQRTRNMPHHAPEKWERFKSYCIGDVKTERAVGDRLAFFTIPEKEKRLWTLDQKINGYGVLVDKKFVRQAVLMDQTIKEALTLEAVALTGLDNPNSRSQLIRWLSQETGDELTTLRKADVPVMLKKYEDETVTRVLEIRQELAKTSVSKYVAMANTVCADGRIRGLFQFAGARTLRWAGRMVQVQNLPQNHLEDLDLARDLVRVGETNLVGAFFGNVPDTLSQLIRTAFVAGKGKTLGVFDFSAIEARVIAWVAKETWRLDVFNTHGKIYEASASKMFGVPIESVTKGSDLRQKGKVAELALGYQGGVGALINMGALKMGLLEEELQSLVDAWREANPSIVKLWKTCDNAAISAIEGRPINLPEIGLKFYRKNSFLFIELPSGRAISYYNPGIKINKFGKKSAFYWGTDSITKKWTAIDSYGGKWVENIVQAIARDCLAETMLAVDSIDFNILMHVHDEIVVELLEEQAEKSFDRIKKIMSSGMDWAPGLPLTADGYLTSFYKKD